MWPCGGFEIAIKTAVFLFQNWEFGRDIKVALFYGYGGIRVDIAMFILYRQYSIIGILLKKACTRLQEIWAIKMNTHIII
jgi:hypothetical protein